MKIVKNSENISGKQIGDINISVYRDNETGLSCFHIAPENDDVIQFCYAIEDTLKKF